MTNIFNAIGIYETCFEIFIIMTNIFNAIGIYETCFEIFYVISKHKYCKRKRYIHEHIYNIKHHAIRIDVSEQLLRIL